MFPDCRQELYLDLVTIMGYWLEDEGQISIHVHYFKEITPWSKPFILKKYSSKKKKKKKIFSAESSLPSLYPSVFILLLLDITV